MELRSPDSTASVVVLYTHNGCHLCQIAHQQLRDLGIEPICRDIDSDESLRQRFNVCVPVVEIDGKIRFRGRIEPLLLRRLLRPE